MVRSNGYGVALRVVCGVWLWLTPHAGLMNLRNRAIVRGLEICVMVRSTAYPTPGARRCAYSARVKLCKLGLMEFGPYFSSVRCRRYELVNFRPGVLRTTP
jgi:hypothetical protein